MSRPNGRIRTPTPMYGSLNPAAVTENGYEEFFNGAVACPTCQGAGRVPRGVYNTTVCVS